jgi:hypothetical protein
VAEAINDTLKAIAASLLMEQVLAPRFTFTPKANGALPDFGYGPRGYWEGKANFGVREGTGQLHFDLAGLVAPKSPEASCIVQEDLKEVIAAFVQNKAVAERGMFDEETAPQELPPVAMGKIVRDRSIIGCHYDPETGGLVKQSRAL